MSDLVALFTALADKSITVSGVTPSVRDLDELKNSVLAADMPIRFLSEIEGGSFELFHLGTNSQGETANTIIWTIQDLLLWKAIGAGQGPKEVMPHLAEYAGKYAEMLRGFRCPVTSMELQTADIQVGRIEWPSQTGQFYMGCRCTLSFQEELMS